MAATDPSARVLLLSLPNAAGLAFLAQSIVDAERQGREALWLCSRPWTSVAPFWSRTLPMLDQNPGGLPLREGRSARKVQMPQDWVKGGYHLVLLGIPFDNPQGDGPEGNRRAVADSRRRLDEMVRRRRPVLHLYRHTGDRPGRSGRAAHVVLSHQRSCHLDCNRLEAPLARLGAIANLAAEEKGCSATWLRRARGLAIRVAGGDLDARLPELMPRLCDLDWDYLCQAPVPDLETCQSSMVVLGHTVIARVDAVPSNLRRHALEEALARTGRTYAVGLQTRRGGQQQMLVARRWRGSSRLPTAARRIAHLVRAGGWVLPSPDQLYSPALEENAFLLLLDEVVEALEGQDGDDLGRPGGLEVRLEGRSLSLGPAVDSPSVVELEASEATGVPDGSGSRWRVRGDFLDTAHPLRSVLLAKVQPSLARRRMQQILAAYRGTMFQPGETGFLHQFRGRLATGVATDEEDLQLVLQRVRAFLAATGWPWEPGLTGSTCEARERAHLQCLAAGEPDLAALAWLLETLGDTPEDVGTPLLPEGVACVMDHHLPRAVIWPSTHSQVIELAVHNAHEHGSKTALLVHVRTADGPEVRVRSYGPALEAPAEEIVQSARNRSSGGLPQILQEVQRMHGVGWVLDASGGCTFSGRKTGALRRRWALVGIPSPPGLPEWLHLPAFPNLATAAEELRRRPAGWCDGLVLAPGVDRDLSAALREGRNWKWWRLPRLQADTGPWLEEILQSPGVEVGWRLHALP